MKTAMQVKFLSEELAVKIKPDQTMACISITNPGDSAPLQKGWGKLLRISFADAVYNEQDIKFFEGMWALSSMGVATKKHALEIRRFIDGVDETATPLLIVHCGTGVSRSAAVAIYAARTFGVPLEGDPSLNMFTSHNTTVLSLLENPYLFDSALPEEPESLMDKVRNFCQLNMRRLSYKK